MAFQKIYQSGCIVLAAKEHINTSLNFFTFNNFIQQFLFEKNLLKIKNSLFMSHLLPDLHQRNPIMRCKFLPAIITLRILLHKFNNLSHFYLHTLTNFPHKHNLQLHSLRMRLGPYKTSRNDLNFIQAFDFFQ